MSITNLAPSSLRGVSRRMRGRTWGGHIRGVVCQHLDGQCHVAHKCRPRGGLDMRTVFALRIAHSRSARAPTMLMEVGLADGPCALTSCLDALSQSKTVPCGCVSGGCMSTCGFASNRRYWRPSPFCFEQNWFVIGPGGRAWMTRNIANNWRTRNIRLRFGMPTLWFN